MRGVAVPLLLLHLEIGVGEIAAQRGFQAFILVESAKRVEQVERKFGCICHRVTQLVHIDIVSLPGIRL